MPRLPVCALALAGWCLPLAAQNPPGAASEPVVVSTSHPRLFLRPARLRLLRRERQRQSLRWQQFDALISGNATMPEPGFAQALYYQVAEDEAAGRRAIAWALDTQGASTADLRQLALVYDWCLPLLNDAQKSALTARITRRMTETASDDSVPAARSRALAAIVLFDEAGPEPQHEIERIVQTWWNGKLAPKLAAGHNIIPREDAYALMELLHAVDNNANLDLRESCPIFFRDFPIERLMSYYPAVFQGAENDFFIGAMRRPAEPSLELAALSRAADLAIVAYDTNAPATQVLQGWLMHDRFLMRGPLGAPYEFLWANPYQPGLSYYHVPLVYYNPDLGSLFVRTTWDEDAHWFGMWDGVMQMFADGHITLLNSQIASEPLVLDEATICFGHVTRRFRLTLPAEQPVFVVGLEPRRTYAVEADDEEMFEATADPSGILELDDLPHGKPTGVRLGPISR